MKDGRILFRDVMILIKIFDAGLDYAGNGIVFVEEPLVIVYHNRVKNKFHGRYRNDKSVEFVDNLRRTYGYNREIEAN